MLSVFITINHIVFGGGSLPKHNATKGLGKEGHVPLQNGLDLRGGEVKAVICCGITSQKANEKLRRRVGATLNDVHPVSVVETTVHEVRCRTALGVVELHPDEIKCGVGNSIAELLIRDSALRRTRDVESLIGVFGVMGPEAVDHRSISYPPSVAIHY